MASLNDEIKLLLEEVRKVKQEGKNAEKIRDIVPASQWVQDPYYVGESGMFLYPKWKELIIQVFETEKDKYNEVIFTGALGTGKTTCAVFMLIRKLYELSCYKRVNALFNLMPNSIIAFAFLTISKSQAKLTGYGQFRATLMEIPYFREHFPVDDKFQEFTRLPENIISVYGSGTQHTIGTNMICAMLDEANFFQRDAQSNDKALQDYDKVSRMYSAILNRAKSRFAASGKDPSLCILISSSTNASSFTEQRIQETQKLGDKSKTLIVNYRTWEVKPKGTYSSENFYVFKGSSVIDPMIVEDVTDINIFLQSMHEDNIDMTGFSPNPNSSEEEISKEKINYAISKVPARLKEFFMPIPVDFYSAFKQDINMSLQDIAGVSVAGNDKLFTSREAYQQMEDSRFRHPFYKEQFTISTGDSIAVQDFLRRDWVPLNPQKPHYIHVDQSLAHDSTGFAMACIDDWQFNPKSQTYFPIISVPLKLRINPPRPPKQISVQKVIEFILYLRDILSFNIQLVTYDQYASAMARQVLESHGVNVDYQSVDRAPSSAYISYTNLLYENRLRSYFYEPEKQELFDLIWFAEAKKVDHPASGCFTGDTKIKLLNGEIKPIKELENCENFELYGCKETGEIIPVVAKKCFYTKTVTELAVVTLDSGAEIKCTKDHLFMMRDGSYKQAHHLLHGDSLMSLNSDYTVSKVSIINCEHTPVYDIEVPATSNFALADGVFVHNSKDVMDAVVGAVYNALQASATMDPQQSDIIRSVVSVGISDYDSVIDVNELFTAQEFAQLGLNRSDGSKMKITDIRESAKWWM